MENMFWGGFSIGAFFGAFGGALATLLMLATYCKICELIEKRRKRK
jgi:hypothetical protein